MTVVGDTGALYAALDQSDQHHQIVTDYLDASSATPIVSPLVLAEVDHLLAARGGERARAAGMAELVDRIIVAEFDHETLESAVDIAARNGKIGIGLTDASIMVIAHRHHTIDVLTTDQRPFRAVRPLARSGPRRYRLLPFDT